MREISLHILDMMQNSIAAHATLVSLEIIEDMAEDILKFTVCDNGSGMEPEFLAQVTDPFTTKRTTRRVGLGIPLLKLAAENTGGGIDIQSKVGKGTRISARFGYSHIDRQPLGDISDTMLTLITAHEDIDFIYSHSVGDKEWHMDTRGIKDILGGVSFSEPEVMQWLDEYIKENERSLYI